MSATPPGASPGLLDSLTTLAATLAAMAHTRIALLSSDLEEDRAHLFALLILVLVALFCLGVGVLLAALLLVVLFWDSYRLLTLCILAGLFLTSGAAAWSLAVRKARSKPRLFSASLAELQKDRQHLMDPP